MKKYRFYDPIVEETITLDAADVTVMHITHDGVCIDNVDGLWFETKEVEIIETKAHNWDGIYAIDETVVGHIRPL